MHQHLAAAPNLPAYNLVLTLLLLIFIALFLSRYLRS